ncbi:MAG: C25 family cysteine peptidase [bacterium]|nr:C25 family cysteine peptidase [bacterium]
MILILLTLNFISDFFKIEKKLDNELIIKFKGPELFATYSNSEEEKYIFPVGDLLISSSPDDPFLPYYEIKVALNSITKFNCSVRPLRVESYHNLLLPTVPKFRNDGLSIEFSTYRGSKTPSENLIYKGETVIINGIPSAYIYFTPYSYDPFTKTFQYIKDAEIVIHFDKPQKSPTLTQGWYDSYLEPNFLNYSGVMAEKEKLLPSNPFDEGILWFQFKITEEGFYSVSYEDLEKAGLPYPFPIQQMAIFIRSVDTLPSSPADTINHFNKLPFEVLDNNGDGTFNSGDELRFFSPGPKGLRNYLMGNERTPLEIIKQIKYFKNPYTDTLSVWLVFGISGESFQVENLASSQEINELYTYYHYEKDLVNIAWKGLLWLGEEIFRPASSQEFGINYHFDLHSLASRNGFFRIQYAGATGTYHQFKAVLNFQDTLQDFSTGYVVRELFGIVNSISESNTLKCQLSTTNPSVEDRIYIDYFTLYYKKVVTALSDETAFFADTDSTVARLPIGSDIQAVFDVTNLYHPRKLGIFAYDKGRYISDTLKPGKIYYFASSIKKPVKIQLTPEAGALYRLRENINYILITQKSFVSSLIRYKNYREKNMLKFVDGNWERSNGVVEICTVEDIMRDFGFGIYDPVAIRNFLKFQYEKGNGNLIYVGLFGDACYDYKNINKTYGNLVPAYEPFLSANIEEEKGAKDDFYADFDGDGFADLLIGRVPFRTKEQLGIFLDKLYKYENNTVFNNWRTKVIFIADDEYGESGYPNEIGFHIPLANNIRRDTMITPPFLEIKLVYETSYGVVGNSVDRIRRGKEAKKDFIRKFNEGSFITTFFGHGNPVQLTHEQLLLLQDLPLLNTNYKNPISMFLSCKVGAFTRENPPLGIAEYMAIYNQSIGTIGSTIGQFVSINYFFGRNIHSTLSDRKLHPLGEVVNRAKTSSSSLTYYHLFGDPATIVYLPLPDFTLNLPAPDTLWIARKNTFELTNLQQNSEYYAILFHKPYEETYTNPSSPTVSVTYLGENKVLYRAPFSPGGEKDSISFFMPGTADTGTGFCFSILRKASDKNIHTLHISDLIASLGNISTQDRNGPDIKVYINGREASEVTEAPLSFRLKVILEDSSGINLYNVFAEEKGVMLFVDNGFIDLTPYFEFYPNSYTKGEVNYLFSSEQPGTKEFKLVAYDNLNNMSQKSFKLNLKSTVELCDEFLIFPNPVSKGDRVYFTFRINKSAHAKFEIFTISGRKIYQSVETEFPEGFNRISWNLRDTFGEKVSNGLYFVKLSIKTADGQKKELIKGFVIGK